MFDLLIFRPVYHLIRCASLVLRKQQPTINSCLIILNGQSPTEQTPRRGSYSRPLLKWLPFSQSLCSYSVLFFIILLFHNAPTPSLDMSPPGAKWLTRKAGLGWLLDIDRQREAQAHLYGPHGGSSPFDPLRRAEC